MAQLQRFGDLVHEMTLCRAVDNYLAYVAELLALVFRARPEALRSGEQVRADFVLRHETMSDLIDALAERRVERLTYAGLQVLHDDIESSLGFELFDSRPTLLKATRYVEIRNLIVHNRAVVNRRFLERLPNEGVALGERLVLEPDDVAAGIALFNDAVEHADAAAAAKWGIERTATLGDG